MRLIIYTAILWAVQLMSILDANAQTGQNVFQGRVIDSLGNPLNGATIEVEPQGLQLRAGEGGIFEFTSTEKSVQLTISYLGYLTNRIQFQAGARGVVDVVLRRRSNELDEVWINTGYYTIPKERATGSFVEVDNKLFNRAASTDLVSRLEGVTNGLYFDRRYEGASNTSLNLRLRGVSSINNDRGPLIVLNNFPYEGDIGLINPNDIESITVLKDAAATSIWGAKAGNGVIVINTKRGSESRPFSISFTSNVNIKGQPDLYDSPSFLSSDSFIEVEKQLFKTGFYAENNWTPLSPVVELLISNREQQISDEVLEIELARLKHVDVRDELSSLLYRQAIEQRHGIQFTGGSGRFQYFLSGGYDRTPGGNVGNDAHRHSLTANLNLQPLNRLSVSGGLNYVTNRTRSNGLNEISIAPNGKTKLYPYAELTDGDGTALPIAKAYRTGFVDDAASAGLLDWHYRPLNELYSNDHVQNSRNVIFDFGINYAVIDGLSLDVKYQYQQFDAEQRTMNHQSSYEARDLINRFSQSDGTLIIPQGGIYLGNNVVKKAVSLRPQLNYAADWYDVELSAIAGLERRKIDFKQGPGFKLYGYNDEYGTGVSMFDYETRYPVRPRGSARIQAPPSTITELADRFISYYGNMALTFRKRYVLTASARWDASNLFGVKTNQKGVPLWSVGGKWSAAAEPFFDIPAITKLDLRFTFGYNGNIDNSITAATTASYSTDRLTGMQRATVRTPANENLRWEKVRTINMGLDFALISNRLSGVIDYYNKRAFDLINDAFLEPTIGFQGNYKINYANLITKGLDIGLNGRVDIGQLKWNPSIMVNLTKNRVIEQDDLPISGILRMADYPRYARKGYSLDAFYSLPWYGLDAETGDPLVLFEGIKGREYGRYISSLGLEDLRYSGVTVPTTTAFMMNSFSYRGLSLSFNIAWKSGHHFRRNTIDYGTLFNNWVGHEDFERRWKKPGDELITQVPAMPLSSNASRDNVFTKSELLVEKGDNLRLQDARLGYLFTGIAYGKIKALELYMYARNLGVLWQATSYRVDPDYPMADILPPATYAFGINLTF